MDAVKDIVLIVSFISSILFLIFGKPRSISDLENKINEMILQLTKSNSNIEELQREIRAMWKKIDYLIDCSMKHEKEISYLKGIINGERKED